MLIRHLPRDFASFFDYLFDDKSTKQDWWVFSFVSKFKMYFMMKDGVSGKIFQPPLVKLPPFQLNNNPPKMKIRKLPTPTTLWGCTYYV